MRLNEIIAVERSIRPLSTACAEIKLPCSFVSQVALVQVNQTAAALYYLPSSQLGLFFFLRRNACCTKLVEDEVTRWKSKYSRVFSVCWPSCIVS